MDTVHFDSKHTDEERRKRLFAGQIYCFSFRQTIKALCDFARELVEEAFAPLDPREAQFSLPVERFVAIGGPLKPRFIHDEKTKSLVRAVVEDLGGDMTQTYVDVPRMRIACHGDYLKAGVGYVFQPHRDTWYSAPMAQLNWWVPIYEFESESSMAFFPRHWTAPVANDSNEFNYYRWNAEGRKDSATHITTDTRKQPTPQGPVHTDPQVRMVVPIGGLILFSGAQLHATVPNTSGRTRFSIDFRTVNLSDLLEGRAAPNVDSAPVGTALRDFTRGTDGAALPQDVVVRYDSGDPSEGVLVYKPDP